MSDDHPRKLLVLYDGDCGFCRRSVDGWRATTGDRIDYAPYQEVIGQYPDIPIDECRNAVQLIDADGRRFRGAEAVFRILAHGAGKRWPLFLYRWLPGFGLASRFVYRFVARHRRLLAAPSRWFWGDRPGPSTFVLSRSLFLRLIGIVYLIAFLSYGDQVLGLNGSRGILPAAEFLQMVRQRFGADGYAMVPTLCWWRCDDVFLKWVLCCGGAAMSGLLVLGFAPAPILLALWTFYLSIVSVGGVFMHFQWDNLLLEAGFLAVFYAPITLRLNSPRASPPSAAVHFLIKWLLFRLMFQSGVVKLTAGDDCWWNLTALLHHYETQPLPTWTAWYAHQLPLWFQKLSVLVMFIIELAAPLLLFGPRRIRHAAALSIIALMVLIGASGNYNFFNLLTAALCVAMFDDALLKRFATVRTRARIEATGPHRSRRVRRLFLAILALFIVAVSAFDGYRRSAKRENVPSWMKEPPRWADATFKAVAPFRTINSYGLFRVMTRTRPEIIVQGSDDGVSWKDYEFRWKPGDLARRPAFVEPHQPRLDWQMWFAALGSYNNNPWLGQFLRRILEGSPDVVALLGSNPFPDAPPRYVRAVRYLYRFTDPVQRRETGRWWRRDEPPQAYSPVLSAPVRTAPSATSK